MRDIRFIPLVLSSNPFGFSFQAVGFSSQRIFPGSTGPLDQEKEGEKTAQLVETTNNLTNSGGEKDDNIKYDEGAGATGGPLAAPTVRA